MASVWGCRFSSPRSGVDTSEIGASGVTGTGRARGTCGGGTLVVARSSQTLQCSL